ncbi:hypothetical protein HET73_07200 [Wolbachia endosymbiont of Atemnus politus]|uniref:hypothetical protein n=1 Tax=Wolbachia endosymbiont of Atemnus politus TaxID=2682840 RepID=UPI0015745736|nr:hypothetical protein [Wolbachia endosymbiont of Atemnus politus]NSM57059.1 hypothetical protein [Wolbachia endosymbiont of Atemnus politus]
MNDTELDDKKGLSFQPNFSQSHLKYICFYASLLAHKLDPSTGMTPYRLLE